MKTENFLFVIAHDSVNLPGIKISIESVDHISQRPHQSGVAEVFKLNFKNTLYCFIALLTLEAPPERCWRGIA